MGVTDFDQIIERRGTGSIKWDRYRDRDIIPLWVADMDFRSPPSVMEALHERVSHGIFGYSSPPDELAHVVAEHLLAEFHWKIDTEWLVWLPGLVTGFNVASRTVGADGDGVVTLVPVYPPFLSAPGFTGRELIKVRLEQSRGRWEIDFERLERSITPRTRLFMLCNPHNPVGRAFDRDELERLADLARRHDLIICSDEIHAGLVLDADRRHIPIASLSAETAARTITLQAPSKTFNIPGLGCSFAVISDPSLRRAYKRSMGQMVPHVTIFGYVATLAAYRSGAEWHRDLIAYLQGNRNLVEQAIGELPGLSTTHVEATYLAWIDARESGLEDSAGFFEAAGVGLSDGREFDGDGYVRLNFGCPRPLLKQALQRMGDALLSRR